LELLGIEVSCCEVWTNCRQKRCTSVIDVHLNTTMRLLTATLSPTPVPWLPVLANIEPPALRRKAAVHKLITKAVEHEECALHDDFVFPSQQKLMSRKPLWSNIQPLNTTARWRDDWKLAVVVNNFFVEDPAIRQPGFDLPRRQWCLLNRFRTAQGHCGAYHKRWGLASNDSCDCAEIQTMSHIVECCAVTKLDGGLLRLLSADDCAVNWLTLYGRYI